MEFLFWTCAIIGLLGAIGMALSGMGLDHADALSAGPADLADSAHVFDAAHMADAAHVADAAHLADAHETVSQLSLGQLGNVLDNASRAGHHLGDLQTHVDVLHALDIHPPVHLGPFNSFSIFGSLAVFGLIGIATGHYMPGWAAGAILSTAIGASLFTGLIVWKGLNLAIRHIDSDSTPSVTEVEGLLAEATMSFAPMGYGELAYEIRGARATAPAHNMTDQPIPQGSKVRLGAMKDHYYLIEPLSPDELTLLANLSQLESSLAVNALTGGRRETA